ncbi:MAG: cytochrome b561 [Candidatus Azotimanducaceae bacterium]|jgi:cytochrome b561
MFNTVDRFGLVSIILHWLMAIIVIGSFGLGWYMVDLTYYDSLYIKLPFLHKSVGIVFGLLLIFRLFWKVINVKPTFEDGLSRLERLAASTAHWGFYCLMALIVVSGYLISTADNSSISVFDIFQVPATITSIPEQEDIAGLVHEYLSYGIIGLTALHASAALKHHFIDKDNSLRKMLGIR